MIYVLNEVDSNSNETTIGVFNTTEISDGKLAEYYGDKFETLDYRDISDSQLEWQKVIKCDGERLTLTLHSFLINEL